MGWFEQLRIRRPGTVMAHQDESGLDQLARIGFDTLGLQTYLTAGPKEARAWTIPKGSKAPQAAGVIHTGYFRSLDQDWRGWPGERQYASVEEDLVLSARHGGRIELSVTLTGEAARDISTRVGWTVQAVVGVEPGEELSRFVRDLDCLVTRAIVPRG